MRRFRLLAVLVLAGCNSASGGSGGTSNLAPPCVHEDDHYKCPDGTTWPICFGEATRQGPCVRNTPTCMGCNRSIAGFTCHCDPGDAAADAGEWFCFGADWGCP